MGREGKKREGECSDNKKRVKERRKVLEPPCSE